ncbi:MAG: hypothetical protein WDM80_18605 [Limisphaerales bacterium]
MIDLQPQMLFGVSNFDRQNVINMNVVLGKAVRIFEVLVVISTVETKVSAAAFGRKFRLSFPSTHPLSVPP